MNVNMPVDKALGASTKYGISDAQKQEDPALRKACRDFESLLVYQIISKMRETVPKSDLFGSSEEEETFQGMMDQEMSKEISNSGMLKLGDVIYEQLNRQKIR